MANSCCGKSDPTVTDNELVWKAIEYAEVKKLNVNFMTSLFKYFERISLIGKSWKTHPEIFPKFQLSGI